MRTGWTLERKAFFALLWSVNPHSLPLPSHPPPTARCFARARCVRLLLRLKLLLLLQLLQLPSSPNSTTQQVRIARKPLRHVSGATGESRGNRAVSTRRSSQASAHVTNTPPAAMVLQSSSTMSARASSLCARNRILPTSSLRTRTAHTATDRSATRREAPARTAMMRPITAS